METTETIFKGGWTAYHKPTTKDKAVFNEVLKDFIGVHYYPSSVATHSNTGTNYRFKCRASMPHPNIYWDAVVEIFQPLNGNAYITKAIRV